MVSKELKTILDNGFGYRNDYFGSEESYKAIDVLEYEYKELENDDIIDGDADYYKLTSKGKETLEVQIVDYTEEQPLLTTDEFYVSVTEKLLELESILDSTEMSDISKDRIYFILDNCATDIYEEL